MKKQNIKVSIIVPVYNVAPYLARCLDSLIAQTLRDIEIICIDDKSTDNSLEILNQYGNKYPQIKVIALDKNSGVSTARNIGIDAATGEYLGFVDSDDYIDADFYEKLYKTARASGADITRGGVKITSYDGATTTDNSEIKNIERHGKWYFAWQWWAAIYRTDMIKGGKVSFPASIISGEDTVFLVKSLVLAESVLIVPDTYYHYIRREGSLDEQIMSVAKITSRITALETISQIYNISDMTSDDYISRYAWTIGALYTHFFKNTAEHSKRQVTDAIVRMYMACRDKGGISKKLVDIMGAHGAAYLKSCDMDGLFNYLCNTVNKSDAFVQTDTFYLFGAIPLLKIFRASERLLVRFCGINVLRVKSAPKDYRIWVLYIPIIRKKRRYKG
ncbi:glycosyltransferase family 2 protein [bacterium]|nr:glycosyltransferase family 2 protein [bacterium]